MKQIFLIRHCKADGQEPDARLTIEGQSQAHALAEYLEQRTIDYLISSPYDRAIDSIRPLARSRNLPIHQDDRLRERVLSARPVED
jgi:2,3-bisphosphoglycerate-dependent phosphoglycerate mutase